MPLYDFKCNKCNRITEVFQGFNDEAPYCCKKKMMQCVTLWAHTPARWGDSHEYFDIGLGKTIRNASHKDKVMKEMGVRPVSDNEIADEQQSIYSEKIQHEKDVSVFTDTLKKTNDVTAAIATAFPHKEMAQE